MARPPRKSEPAKELPKWTRYRNGGDGFIEWANDNVWVSVYPPGCEFAVWVPMGADLLPIGKQICPGTKMTYEEVWTSPHPTTGRSYREMWWEQQKIVRQALRMEAGEFLYRVIVFCWPRGEGKSFLAVLIQMWKFFCWPRQDIKFCANSREQTGHAHYKIARETIENSPNLLKFVGKKNIQELVIRLKDSKGRIQSKLQIISTASGIFSNITGYAFSEIFELKNEDFFNKVDGSVRNIPNALGVIDSTVSSKEHLLYRLYDEGWVKKKDKLLFFSYRYSEKGDFADYWSPRQTQPQLDSYRVKQGLSFAKFFLNLWSAGADKVFSAEEVEAINYLGASGQVNHARVVQLIRRKHQVIDSDKRLIEAGVQVWDQAKELDEVDDLLWPVAKEYDFSCTDEQGSFYMTSAEALCHMGDIFDTDWAIIAGIDRAMPMKRRTGARTIYLAAAKGLPGSRSNPSVGYLEEPDSGRDRTPRKSEYVVEGPSYIYLLVHVAQVMDHSLDGLKREMERTHTEFDGLDTVCAETWGTFDLSGFCEGLDIKLEVLFPSFSRQNAAFSELFALVADGRFKTPPVPIAGSNGGDILIEEAKHFDYDERTRWFGSPEKNLKKGVQDDCMYAWGWMVYGGRGLTVDDFRPRRGRVFWGAMLQPGGLLGRY